LIPTVLAKISEGLVTVKGTVIVERVATWLLKARSLNPSEMLPVTHAMIASSLGVRRSGVTVALHELEGWKAIRSNRRHVVILDQAILARVAGGSGGPRRTGKAALHGAASR
jgi:CRP-like cAMP-binding protein